MPHPDTAPTPDLHSAMTTAPRRAVPAWMMSLALHATIALGLAWFAVVESQPREIDPGVQKCSFFPAPSITPDETVKEHATTPGEVPMVDVPQPPSGTTTPPTPDAPDAPDTPSTEATTSGDVPNLISSDAHPEPGSTSIIGVGSASGTPFRGRTPNGKKRLLVVQGGAFRRQTDRMDHGCPRPGRTRGT